MSDMALVTVWLRLDLRRRWRSLLVLALLVALASGTVLASVAGARRGDTAGPRLLARTLPADATVLPNQPGFDWDRIRALPEVTALSTFPVTEIPVEGIPEESWGFPFADTEAMRTIERPVVLNGRIANPDRADEVVVTPRFPSSYHKGVGDTVTLRLYTPRQVDAERATGDIPAPAGPRIKARIVGTVRTPFFADDVHSKGALLPSPALFARYRANILGFHETARNGVYINAFLRLKGGEAALPKFRTDLARVTGRHDIEVWNQADFFRHFQKVESFESACLLAFGIAALLAAFVLVGQTVARYTAATVVDLQILRAVGMTPRQTLVAAAAAPFLAAAAGSSVGVAGAVMASRWMPIGAASTAEPSPGFDVDWLVLGPGWVLVPLIVLAGAIAAARFATRRPRASARRSAIAAAAARAGLPVPVVVGTRFALEPGSGQTAVPIRPALLGAVVGVLGVLAAFTFSAGVSDAVAHRERFGQTNQLESFVGFNGKDFVDPATVQRVLGALAKDHDVVSVNDARIAVAESGSTSVTMYTHAPLGAPYPVVLSDGALPHGTGGVVLAPTTAHRLDAHVGSVIRFRGSKGSYPLRVSGIGFVPEGSHNGYDDGGWLTAAGYDRLFSGFKDHMAEIVLRPGTDVAAAVAQLQKAAAPFTGGAPIDLQPPEQPTQVAELQDIRVLPVVLGGFLLVLALGAVGHALAIAVRRRRHEMAVLRALGMTRWQCRGVVVTQASVLAVVGLAFGVPVGIALARVLWRHVATTTPLDYHPPLAVWALALVVPLALVLANLLAAWPGHRAARLRVGQTLRTE
jgi:hypothetical protein